jgi:hypothetical protein
MMDHPHEPIDAIKTWQDWYKSHRIVAQLDKPLITKDSRENMHDTTQATDTFKETDTKAIWMQKAKEHFADTLAEYQYELSGKDFYKAFYQAAYEYLEATKKEYERTKELVDMLRYKELGQD